MLNFLTLALAIVAAPDVASPVRAGLPAAQAIAARYDRAVVVVERPQSSGAVQKSQGFFISSTGLLCTILPGARVGDVVVIDNDEIRGGAVVVVDEDGLALVAVNGATDVAALGVSAGGKPSLWMVGLSRSDAGVQGALGGLEGESGGRWRLLLPLPRGAPILDDKNDVVAIAVVGRGGGLLEALPVKRLKALVARLPDQPVGADSP